MFGSSADAYRAAQEQFKADAAALGSGSTPRGGSGGGSHFEEEERERARLVSGTPYSWS